MVGSTNKHRMVNSSLALRIIELHNNGYDLDFYPASENEIICLQDDRNFYLGEVSVKVIEQVFDEISRSYKYIHTIDTGNNCKGLLIIESIVTVDELSEVPKYPATHDLPGRNFYDGSRKPSIAFSSQRRPLFATKSLL